MSNENNQEEKMNQAIENQQIISNQLNNENNSSNTRNVNTFTENKVNNPLPEKTISKQSKIGDTSSLSSLVGRLKNKYVYEPVDLPSRCIVYGDFEISKDQKINVRPMTIAEEKLLSTPRLVKNGEAINKIFEQCIQDNLPPDSILSIDRTYLLFYIRGISYGQMYDAEIKCPECNEKFEEEINLSDLEITFADDDFNNDIMIVLPESKLKVWYRLPTGKDEKSLMTQRERKIKGFGSNVIDDTISIRNKLLINRILDTEDGTVYEDKLYIGNICDALGVKDSAHLREEFTNPPFGVNTKIGLSCPYCYADFITEFPLDASFFFPKTKKKS